MGTDTQAQNHFYDGWVYGTLIDPSLAGIRRRVAALVPKGSRVIDIGCGTGDQLFYLAGHIHSGLGIELSDSMIQTARQQSVLGSHDNCEFQLADATDLSHLKDKSFDFAMSSMVIHEMPEAKRLPVLCEMKRLGKQIILVDWIHPQPSFWKSAGTHFVERMAGRDHYAGFRSYMQAGGMPTLIEQIGLAILETQITSKGTIQLWLCHPVKET